MSVSNGPPDRAHRLDGTGRASSTPPTLHRRDARGRRNRPYGIAVAADRELIECVRGELAAAGDPARAAEQQRYMMSAMPYHGVTAPELRRLLRPHLRMYQPADRASWEATVRTMWDEATHREERYAALALARHPTAKGWLDPPTLDLARHLIVTGAWWDLVDETAAHVVVPILARHPDDVTPVMRQWARDDDEWVRRAAVLSQLGRRAATDTGLLRDVIALNLDDRSFWLRKAIGWALREYARTDPDWVRAAVAAWGDRMAGLSRREALKHLSGQHG